MWSRTFNQAYSGVKRQNIWDLWVDMDNWPKWHGDLDSCKMQGEFKAGNHFLLKPKGMKTFKIMLTDVQAGYQFTDCTTFFGAKMYDTHAMEETPDGLRIINTLVVTGPLKWLWIKLVAKNVADTVPEETEALVKLARELK